MEKLTTRELQIKAYEIRKWVITAVSTAKSGHPGGSLSEAEILSVLYFDEMNVDSSNPRKEDRDRFILSKGHTCPALYSALALRGFFDTEELYKFRNINSFLQGHPSLNKVPGVDMSTGSLGQGLSVANGMALAGKMDNNEYRVYVMLGDGEIQEGQVWEAAMTSSHYKLDNICVFLDNNGLQIDGSVADVMNPEPLDKKFDAFGWNVIKIDGHDINQILEALKTAKQTKGKPTIIIATTVKGKGVSFMENDAAWHGSAPNKQQEEQALQEIEQKIKELEVV